MKRASFIQSLSLILGGIVPINQAFEDGPNHIFIEGSIKTIDKILIENIKNKKHLKMFQHMIPAWVRSNKVNLSRRSGPLDYLAIVAYAAFSSWGAPEAYQVMSLLGSYSYYEEYDYNDEIVKLKDEQRLKYEERLNKLYNSLKETQTV